MARHRTRSRARAGAGIAAASDYFAAAEIDRGGLQRVLCDWSFPGSIASAVTPGRKLMPAKTRAFLEMLQRELGEPAPGKGRDP